jgi:hypothetical protein
LKQQLTPDSAHVLRNQADYKESANWQEVPRITEPKLKPAHELRAKRVTARNELQLVFALMEVTTDLADVFGRFVRSLDNFIDVVALFNPPNDV